MLCHRDANEILTLCIQIQCIHGESQFSAPTCVIKRMLLDSVNPQETQLTITSHTGVHELVKQS